MAYWGVDSCTPASASFLSEIESATGGTPTFWGRYLPSNSICPNGYLTPTEVSFLHGKGIKILPIVNDWNFSELTTYDQGVAAANHCIALAENNGYGVSVPAGTMIALDLETENPNYAWVQGFADTMFNSAYVGALYCNQPDVSTEVCLALTGSIEHGISGDGDVADMLIYGTEPNPGWTTKAGAPAWGPDTMPCGVTVAVWQYFTTSSSNPDYDEDLATSLDHMW